MKSLRIILLQLTGGRAHLSASGLTVLSLLAMSLLTLQPCYGNVKLPTLFSDNMVLQRSRPLPVWGEADAGERVTVQIQSQSASAVADNTGHWRVTLNPLSAGGP